MRKRAKKVPVKAIVISVAIILVLLGVILIWKKTKVQMPERLGSVSEVTAEREDMANTIVGTGNLESEVTEELTIPDGISMDEVKVESGDVVKKGDTLAKVNTLSVLTRMVEVQTQVSELEEKLDNASDDTDILEEQKELWTEQKETLETTLKSLQDLYKNPTIKAKKNGTVGEVYVSKETSTNSSTSDLNSENTKKTATQTTATQNTTIAKTLTTTKQTTIMAQNMTVTKSSRFVASRPIVMAVSGKNQTEDVWKESIQQQTKDQDDSQKPSTQEPSENNQGTGSTENNQIIAQMPRMQTKDADGQENSMQNKQQMADTSGAVQQTTTQTENNTDTQNDVSTDVIAFTFASEKNMLVTVSVDELDINSVSKGQQAEVTLDALSDKTFSGVVKKISSNASTANSGVAKYSVQIQIPKNSQMKAGMNASATITVEKKESVITIPVSALQERGDTAYVYTQKDADGTLKGETEVKTGLSDGSKVEIVEGLEEGTSVYYQKIGKSEKSSDVMDEMKGGFGNQPGYDGGGGMPQAPAGGEMPNARKAGGGRE